MGLGSLHNEKCSRYGRVIQCRGPRETRRREVLCQICQSQKPKSGLQKYMQLLYFKSGQRIPKTTQTFGGKTSKPIKHEISKLKTNRKLDNFKPMDLTIYTLRQPISSGTFRYTSTHGQVAMTIWVYISNIDTCNS